MSLTSSNWHGYKFICEVKDLDKRLHRNGILQTAYSDTFLLPHLKDLNSQHVLVSKWCLHVDEAPCAPFFWRKTVSMFFTFYLLVSIPPALPSVPTVPLPALFPRYFSTGAQRKGTKSSSGSYLIERGKHIRTPVWNVELVGFGYRSWTGFAWCWMHILQCWWWLQKPKAFCWTSTVLFSLR